MAHRVRVSQDSLSNDSKCALFPMLLCPIPEDDGHSSKILARYLASQPASQGQE